MPPADPAARAAIEAGAAARRDRCVAECSQWAPFDLPGTGCPTEICYLPGQEYLLRTNGYVKRWTRDVGVDTLIAWGTEMCGKRPNGSWLKTGPPGRQTPWTAPGVPKRRGRELPPIAPPAPAGIPGQLAGEICAPVALSGLCGQLYLCESTAGSYWVCGTKRAPRASINSTDALIVWVNSP